MNSEAHSWTFDTVIEKGTSLGPAIAVGVPASTSLFGPGFDTATRGLLGAVLREADASYPDDIDNVVDSVDSVSGSVSVSVSVAVVCGKELRDLGDLAGAAASTTTTTRAAVPEITTATVSHASASGTATTSSSASSNTAPASAQKPKTLFEIRNMNPLTKKAFDGMMHKMGEKCNMRFNEEKMCWEERPGVEETNVQVAVSDKPTAFNLRSTQRTENDENQNPKDTARGILDECGENSVLDEEKGPTGLSFLNEIDDAMQSLAQITVSKDLVYNDFHPTNHPPTLPSKYVPTPIMPYQEDSPQESLILSNIDTSNTSNANVSLLNLLNQRFPAKTHNWPQLLDLTLDESNLMSLSHLETYTPNILRLSISFNDILYLTGIPACLSTLIAKGNRLSNLTSFTHLRNLKYADLSANNISDLEPLACACPSLRELNISGNCLTSIRFSSEEFTNLCSLDASQNQIVTVEISASGMESLQSLYLDHNQIKTLHISSRTLRKLNVEGNSIDLASNSGFLSLSGCDVLQSLNLGNNAICTTAGFDVMANVWPPKVQDLYLQNQMMGLSSILTLPTTSPLYLRNLTLSGTRICDLSIISNFKNLETLIAKRCNLTSFSTEFCSAMDHLKVLKLSFNEIVDLSGIQMMQSLIHLDISHNQIIRFKPTIGSIQRLGYLEMLDLRWNPITELFYPSYIEETNEAFVARDRQFKKQLGDAVYLKRLCYRSVLSKSSLRVLDGMLFERREREKADECIKALGKQAAINK